MPLKLVRNDITKIACDAVVNAANSSLLGGGGVDGAIHRAAGPELLAECRTLGGCKTGEAKATKGYRLPAKYVIHTVGPVWEGGEHGEKALLTACYRNSLDLAAELGCESVAFPLISSGVYGYPKQEAVTVAVRTITDWLMHSERDMAVTLTLFDRAAVLFGERLAEVREFVDDHYVEAYKARDPRRRGWENASLPVSGMAAPPAAAMPPAAKPAAEKRPFPRPFRKREKAEDAAPAPVPVKDERAESSVSVPQAELDRLVLDESFSQMLLRKIDEKGMKDSECYKKANIDRKLFSKIRSDPQYKPSKPTAVAFAIALELSLGETRELLMKAGFALSHSNYFDLVVEYFISRGNYDIFEINEALFAYDQVLLGA